MIQNGMTNPLSSTPVAQTEKARSISFGFYLYHHQYWNPCLPGKLYSTLPSLLQISSESAWDAELKILTATQNKCSELSNKDIFAYAGRLGFQVCVHAPGYIEMCAAEREYLKAVMNMCLKYICNIFIFFSDAILRKKKLEGTQPFSHAR